MLTPSGRRSSEPVPVPRARGRAAQQGGHRGHQDGPQPPQAGLVDGFAGGAAFAPLEIERDVDDHDRVLLDDADEQDDADHRDDRQLHPAREQRAHPGRGQGGQDGERVDEALVQHAQHEVDRDQGGQDQERLGGQRGLEGLGGARELAADARRGPPRGPG
jgi:hypothetical protein